MATQLFLRTDFADIGLATDSLNLRSVATAGWQRRLLGLARGSSVLQLTTTAIAGPTTGIDVTTGASATYEWISPPLAADVTIAGTITANIWGRESAASVNAAINIVVEVIRANALGTRNSNTLVQIVKSARTTEMAVSTTANSVANFTMTPTSTVVNRGDRLRIRVFGDDAGTMSASGTFGIGVAGPTAAANGDTYVTFTETFSFESAPAGTVLYLTDTASDVATASVDREAWTARGGGVVSDVVNTAAGWAAPIQLTDTAGGTVVDWYSKRLNAFTLTGMAVANLRANESDSLLNVALRCEIARVEADGSSPTVWASWAGASGLGTSEAVRTINVSGDDLAISNGQRLRFRIYIDDAPDVPMPASHTATFYYAGTSAATSGDSYITLPQTVTEFVSGTAHTATPSDSVTLTDARTAARGKGITDTFALADAFSRATATQRTVADTFTLTDTRTLARAKTVTDTLTLADLLIAGRSQAVPLADVLALVDAVNIDWTALRPQNERVDLTDSFTRIHVALRAVADALVLADLATPVKEAGGVTHSLPLADVLALSDVFARVMAYGRTQADGLILVDSTRDAQGIRLGDTLALTDLLNRLGSSARTLADTLTLVDARGIGQGKHLGAGPNAALNPYIEANVTNWSLNNATETVTRSAEQAHQGGFSLKTVTPGSASAEGVFTVAAAGTAVVGQWWTIGAWIYSTDGDPLTLQLSERNAASSGLAVYSQNFTPAAGVWQYVSMTRQLAQATVSRVGLKVITNGTRATTFYLDEATMTSVEMVGLTDVISPVNTVGAISHTQPLADTVTLTDQLRRAQTLARTLADTIVLADARRIAQGQALADAVALSDQLTRIAPRIRTFTDTVLLSDAVLTSKTGAGALNPADLVSLSIRSHASQRMAACWRTAVALTDARALGRGKRVTDQVLLADLLARATGKTRTVNDLIALIDHVVTSKVTGGYVLNYATDIRWGEIQADLVLVGMDEVWSP